MAGEEGSSKREELYRTLLSLKSENGGFRLHKEGEVDIRQASTVIEIACLRSIDCPYLWLFISFMTLLEGFRVDPCYWPVAASFLDGAWKGQLVCPSSSPQYWLHQIQVPGHPVFVLFFFRGAYCAIATASMLHIVTEELMQGLAQYIASCQGYDGGIGGQPGLESHGGYTYCGEDN